MYFYFILMVNLALVVANGYLWVPKKLVLFLAYITLTGLLGIAAGTASPAAFAKDIAGILPCALYFGGFFRWINFDVKKCFAYYAKLSYHAAIFGILYLPVQGYPAGRLKSICAEPSGYALVILPALFYYGDLWQRERKYGLRFLVILLSLILTFSSLGFAGLFFGVYLFGTRYKFGKLVAPIVIVGLATFTYSTSYMVRQRISDAVIGAYQGDIGDINQSTFGTVINFFITQRVFKDYPVFGGGLGSYVVFHDRYFSQIPGTQFIFDPERTLIGQWDASSLFLRITAEFGLVGIIGSFWFLWRYWPRHGTPEERAIAMGILCYVLGKFLRDGIYFNPEVFFFFGAYVVNGLLAQRRATAPAPHFSPSPGSPALATS